MTDRRPLAGLRVLDFSTLLPGPLATLLLAEAGADVLKIERPGGEEMRYHPPQLNGQSVTFALLNRGKRSLVLDLKSPDAVARLRPLVAEADILVEQFRPGVMDRLGLGYEALRAINPRLIYCSITGYGQTGPKRDVAAHDLNYCAEAGILSLAAGSDGAPVVPPVLGADIAGGAYPAVMNILLALVERQRSGQGACLDVSMSDNMFTFAFWALGAGLANGVWPKPGGERLTGGSPRYHIYRTKDDRFLAAAPLEQRFWLNFCAAIGLPDDLRDDARDPAATIAAVASLVRGRSAEEWQAALADKDVCCCIVATIEEAVADPHFQQRGLFEHQLAFDGMRLPALPVPIDRLFRGSPTAAAGPSLDTPASDS